jgi:flagella synthesis protein FlgN
VNATADGTTLDATLLAEVDTAKELNAILSREQDALVQGDISSLETLSQRKADAVRKLSDLAERRRRHFATQGWGPGNENMTAWLRDGVHAPSTTTAWHDLMQLARTAQHLNQTNGAMIAARLHYARQAFAALQGAAGVASMYGPNGQTLASGHGRTLGSV